MMLYRLREKDEHYMYSMREYAQKLLEVVDFDKQALLRCREIS